jgi:hypothetical protein
MILAYMLSSRLFLYVFPSGLCCQPRAISPSNIWQTSSYKENTFKRDSASISYHHCIHHVRQRLSIINQLLRCSILGILLLDGKANPPYVVYSAHVFSGTGACNSAY